MGFVTVFTLRPLMPGFCLVTVVCNVAGINNRTLPLSTWVPLTHTCNTVTSHSLSPAHRGKRKGNKQKSSLMAACLESTWKADPFKVQPGVWSRTIRGIFCLQWQNSTHQRNNGKCDVFISLLSYLFTLFLHFLYIFHCLLLWLKHVSPFEQPVWTAGVLAAAN